MRLSQDEAQWKVVMLQICQDNYDSGIIDDNLKRSFGLEWNVDDMVQHQKKMLKIIMNYPQ